MSWLRIDDGFAENEKIIDLSDRGFRLHVAALCYSARNLTDGQLTERAVRVLCALTNANRRHLIELCAAALWHHNGDGSYTINDYLDFNPSKQEVRERQRVRSEAGRRGGQAKALASARPNARASANSAVSSTGAQPPPVPTPEEQDQVLLARAAVDRSLRSVG